MLDFDFLEGSKDLPLSFASLKELRSLYRFLRLFREEIILDEGKGSFSFDFILEDQKREYAFPNTFLEAWSNFNPIVSLNVDPDEIICSNKLGFHSKTIEQMIKDIKTLINNKKLHHLYSENGREYVEKTHSLDKIIHQYEQIIKSTKE